MRISEIAKVSNLQRMNTWEERHAKSASSGVSSVPGRFLALSKSIGSTLFYGGWQETVVKGSILYLVKTWV